MQTGDKAGFEARGERSAVAGKVSLVGAGPGDPELITHRGLMCLADADVVLYDYLANPRVLETCSAAKLECLGRHGRGKLWTQEQINSRMISDARAGKKVVRLKAGDPGIFARFAEETEALHAAGVPYEVVPGITAAMAVASYCGVPLTHRELSSAVAFVTGQQKDDQEHPAPLDYRALASFPGTLVFYMGVTTAKLWTSELIAGGKSPATPAAVVRRCSWPDQSMVRCRLDEVSEILRERQLRPPILIIVGDVVSQAAEPTWFTQRPLFGTKVLVTRPLEQASLLRDALEQQGAEVFVQPAIEIAPPEDWSRVDEVLARLKDFDWLVFSSANGVRAMLDRIRTKGGDMRWLGGIRLAAIGPGTADELARYSLHADLVPDEYRAENLADILAGQGRGLRFLLARASRGREVLSERLRAAGSHVEQIVVYQSRDVLQPDPEIRAALAAGRIDWVTVTSSAIARSLVNQFGEDLRCAKLASISPITSQTLRELDFPPAIEATEYTMSGVVQALVAAVRVAP